MNDAQVRLWNLYDVNALSEDERKLFCLTRGRSIEIIAWLSMTYTSGTKKPIQELFLVALVDTCKLLCDYKWQADAIGLHCSPDFTLDRLKSQIHATLALMVAQLDILPTTLEKLAWDPAEWELPMPENFSRNILLRFNGISVEKSSAPFYQQKTQTELFKLGETTLDRKFAQRLRVKREIIGTSISHSHRLILMLCLEDIETPTIRQK